MVDEADSDFAALLEQLPATVWRWAVSAIRLAIGYFEHLAEESYEEGEGDTGKEMSKLAGELQGQLSRAYQQHGPHRLDVPEPRPETWKALPGTEERWCELLRTEAGIDVARAEDSEAVLNLAVIGPTNSLWRNSPLEDAHAKYDTERHTDAAMMRHNVATTLAVRQHLAIDRIDAAAIMAGLTDPDRMLPGGVRARALLDGEWDDFVAYVRERTGELEDEVREFGERTILINCATHGALACRGWYGTPWWPDVVDVFIEMLSDPTSAAWRYDERNEPEPQSVRARDAVRAALLSNPAEMSLDAVGWCLSHGIGFDATTEGRRRCLARRNDGRAGSAGDTDA